MIEVSTLRKKTDSMYTALFDAKNEILRRWKDPILKRKVQNFWGKDFELLAKDGPSGCLGRNIMSPNYELKYFFGLCQEVNLTPLLIEHCTDKFVASNPDKYHLARMYFYDGRGKKNGDKYSAINIIDIGNSEGKKINQLHTVSGENFVEFHHRIMQNLFPSEIRRIVDVGSIDKLRDKKLSDNYDEYLSIFVYFGVLFENYLPHKSGPNFLDIVHRAFDKAYKYFGVKPLIVPLSPIADQDNTYWGSYPSSLKSLLEK